MSNSGRGTVTAFVMACHKNNCFSEETSKEIYARLTEALEENHYNRELLEFYDAILCTNPLGRARKYRMRMCKIIQMLNVIIGQHFLVWIIIGAILEGLGSYGGDTLNSVQTTLNHYLEIMLDDNEEYRQHMEGKTPRASAMFYLQLYCIYGKDFIIHFEKKTGLIQFIEFCHTLGNLVVVPAIYNGHRGSQSFIRDYSDLSLDNLKYSRDNRNFLGENDKIRKRNFRKNINILFLWDYADKNYNAVPLCESHRIKLELLKKQNTEPDAEYVMPRQEEIDDLCRNINGRIKRRSVFMTAMLRIALGINIDGTVYSGGYKELVG